jgi:hypothetical protein
LACAFERNFSGLQALEIRQCNSDATRTKKMQHDRGFGTDHDLLLGVEAITAFLNSLFDPETQVTKQVVYVWCAENYIPTRRIGQRIVGSKTAIRRALFPAPVKIDA